MFEIVGIREIANRLSVEPHTVEAWVREMLLPEPEGLVSGVPAWRWITIEAWARQTGRLGLESELVRLLSDEPHLWTITTIAATLSKRGYLSSTATRQVQTALENLLEIGLVECGQGDVWKLASAPLY